MCLSTVYKTSSPDTVIMEYVSRIRVDGDRITLTDIMGAEKTVIGKLTLADLTGAVVQIDCEEPAD